MPLRVSDIFKLIAWGGTLCSSKYSPILSMDDDVVDSKKKKATKAAAAATATKKRPRRITRTEKPKYNDNEEEDAPTLMDIEDLSFSRNETLEIRASLLEWYDVNQRDLPWRRISSRVEGKDSRVEGKDGNGEEESERRAYAVWVSEVMLQQTRVQAVIGYFNRWMEKWPTLGHLSRASLEEVNEMWAGLGYYRRARYLLEGAKKVVEGGEIFPKTVAALRKVPGIGDYTAGAIASIAFKEAVPVVDANVVRVVARLKAISANPKHSVTIKNFWKLSGQLVDPSRPGDFNQALMEFGATLCTSLSPSCSACPVSAHCHALSLATKQRSAQVTDYPIKVVKSKQRRDFAAVTVVEILEGQDAIEELQPDGRFLLVKRPEEGLLAGLWEFPSVLVEVEADLATRRHSIDQFLKKSFKLDLKNSCSVVLREDIGEYVHVFSHIRLKMFVELLVIRLIGGWHVLHGKPDSETMAWKSVDSKALSSMGLTSGVRKVYSMIQKFKQDKSKSIPGKATKKMTSRTQSFGGSVN